MTTRSLVYKGTPPDHCCCDQAVRRLADGTLATFFMTGGVTEPCFDNFVAMSISTDEGESWGKPEKIYSSEGKGCPLSEVIVDESGKITVFVQSHDGFFENWECQTITSVDNGKTWSEAEIFAPMPQRAFIRNLLTPSWGEWLLPYQVYSDSGDIAESPLKNGTHRGYNGVLISNDKGASWTVSASTGPTDGWAENNIAELSGGTLVMLVRADGKGHLLRSESTDHGRTWSPLVKTDIPNPGSKFRLFMLSQGHIALIHNPNPNPGRRNPMELWISSDDMKTWGEKRLITDFPGQLQYPDGFYDAQANCIHFVFDYNRHDVVYYCVDV